MSDQPKVVARALHSKEGELFLVRISIDPRQLEELLDSLAHLDFPVNPQIYHTKPTLVEFPAYAPWLDGVYMRLALDGFERDSINVRPMLAAIAVA
jgi:hypothetical protein